MQCSHIYGTVRWHKLLKYWDLLEKSCRPTQQVRRLSPLARPVRLVLEPAAGQPQNRANYTGQALVHETCLLLALLLTTDEDPCSDLSTDWILETQRGAPSSAAFQIPLLTRLIASKNNRFSSGTPLCRWVGTCQFTLKSHWEIDLTQSGVPNNIPKRHKV